MSPIITKPELNQIISQLETIEQCCEAVAQHRELSPAATERIAIAFQRAARNIKDFLQASIDLAEEAKLNGWEISDVTIPEVDDLINILNSVELPETTSEVVMLEDILKEHPMIRERIESLLDSIRSRYQFPKP